MDKSMVEVLLAQGLSENEAYERIALYYQMLAEGCTRAEARKALRSDNALDYLERLVSAAIRGIIDKGFQPEEVEDAINQYYRPWSPKIPYEFPETPSRGGISEYPDPEVSEYDPITDELEEYIRENCDKDE